MTQFPAVTNAPGYSVGKPEKLGYTVVGDIMLSFAAWVIEQARRDGLKVLYFLARDGEIVKKAADRILSYLPGHGIRTEFLLASRRALRVSSIVTKADLQRELEGLLNEVRKNRFPSTTVEYLSMRFGLSSIDLTGLGADTLPSSLSSKSSADELDAVRTWVMGESVSDAILRGAKIERDVYQDYLNEKGVGEDPAGFVDIGHNGSLQASICRLRGLNSSRGYYFATYSGVDEVISALPGNHSALGYYRDRTSTENRDDKYIRYALLVESLFLNERETFIRMKRNSHDLIPEYLSGGDARRVRFNKGLHAGVCKYVDDALQMIASAYGAIDLTSLCSSDDVCRRFFSMLESPERRDAEVYSGVTLENYFAGKTVRYFVPPFKLLEKEEGIWREGTRRLRSTTNDKLAPAFSTDPTASSDNATYEAAHALLANRRFTEAAAAYEELHSSGKFGPNALRRAAEAYLLAGERNKAIEALEKARNLLPNNHRVLRRLLVVRYPPLRFVFGESKFDAVLQSNK